LASSAFALEKCLHPKKPCTAGRGTPEHSMLSHSQALSACMMLACAQDGLLGLHGPCMHSRLTVVLAWCLHALEMAACASTAHLVG
jgi:hypothetical protein